MKKIIVFLFALIALKSSAQVACISISSGQSIFTGLSSDTKPTIPSSDLAVFLELNTAKIYYNNAGVWTCASCLTYAPLASPTFTGTTTAASLQLTGVASKYNNINTVGVGMPSLVATIDATAQTANIATSTLYAVPASGFYRVSIYITLTSAGTTSTMPSTTITYTDGNSGTNAHSTTTTATNTGNSLTTSFAQTSYVCYAKSGTNIQYATGGYASTGSAMQYALRIRVEAL